jgi:LAGLIDADG endonuclease
MNLNKANKFSSYQTRNYHGSRVLRKEINTCEFKIPLIKDSKEILDPSFITGFTDAEGSFMIQITESKMSKLGWAVIGSFQIRLHSKELPLLKEIQKFFGGIGKISILFKDQSATYLVRDIKSLTNVIVPHFDLFPLQSAKKLIMNYGKNVYC